MNRTLVACRGTFFANGEIRIGALQFFDGETNAEAVVYYDTLLTTPAPNPIPIDINGNIPQVYGNKFYKVKQYAIKPTGTSFPADYDEILDFYWDASTSTNGVSSLSFVDTVSALKVLQPANGDSVGLLGYYAKGDARFRVFTFNSTSIDTPNNGNRIRPNGYGAGAWEENSSSVIYASDFGLVGTANANGNMAQLVSWCNGNGVTCVFDKGIYNLTAGSATFSNKVIIEDGAYFNVTGGEFALALNGVFEVPQKSFGSALFLLDVRGSGYVSPSGLAPEIWGVDNTAKWYNACTYSGSSGLRLDAVKTIPNVGSGYVPDLKRLVVVGAGELVFNNVASSFLINILSIEFQGRSEKGRVFSAVDGVLNDRLLLSFNALSSWFDVALENFYTVAQSTTFAILIDQNTTCGSNITVPYLRGTGGKLTTSATVTITKCEGSNFLARSGSGVYSGVSNINHFADLSTENGIKCFIESNTSLADFQGVPTGANISVGSVKLSNMRHSGTITSSADIEGYNCVFSGAITAKSVQLMSCTTLGITINASAIFSVVLKSCITNGAITINSLTTDKIDKLIIENCYNRSAPTPLVVTNCLSNSRQTGSIISVRNNVPECFADDAVPVGAWAQSYIDTELTTDTVGAPATYNYALSGKAFALLFPNIDIKTGVRLNTSSLSDLALSAGKDVITKTVGGATRVLTIVTNGVLVSSAKVRVTGNLY